MTRCLFRRRLLAPLLALLLVLATAGLGAADAPPSQGGPSPGNPEKDAHAGASSSTGASLSSTGPTVVRVQNADAAADIHTATGRYNFGLRQRDSTRWYNISYYWPYEPWSSFATVRIDGDDMVYGSGPAGVAGLASHLSAGFIEPPHNTDGLTNTALWRAGDITVRQVVQLALNPATGAADAIGLRYVLTNAGVVPHQVGLRILIDTMLNGNDGAPFRVPTPGGMASILYERDFTGPAVPDFWQAYQNLADPDIAAQFTLRGAGATPPDRVAFAHWSYLYPTLWDYTVNPTRLVTNDSAVGMWWHPAPLAPGETRTVVTYYGRPRVGGDSTLALSCPGSVSHPDWSTRPTTAIAYLNNFGVDSFFDVFFEITPGGATLPDGDPVHTVGEVPPGTTAQTNWRLAPTGPGLATIHVAAYRDAGGTPSLIAASECEIDFLPPPVPEHVSVEGAAGTTGDGTPVARRCSPLTVEALYPHASSVDLEVTDADGDGYGAAMTLLPDGSGRWRHTFVPCAVGLWESPLTIRITPHYPDGSSGPPSQFEIELIDPSGYIYHAGQGTGWRLPGAIVTLEYYDPALGVWVTMSDAAYPGRMHPVTNPQTTGSDGRYGWDAAAGSYRVRVTRPGFAPATSPVVTIPPPVTDLHVGLTPTDATPPTVGHSGVSDGATYTAVVTVAIDATDGDAGVRYVAYRLNGGAEVTVDGDHADLTVSSQGSHTVDYRAVDHAGNEQTGSVSFQIATDTTPPTISHPTYGSTYRTGEAITLSWTATDTGSGVATTGATLDGRPVHNGDVVSPPAGRHTLDIYATDHAGNTATTRVRFAVYHDVLFLSPLDSPPAPVPAGDTIPIELVAMNLTGGFVADPSVKITVWQGTRLRASYIHGTGPNDIHIGADRYTLTINPTALGFGVGDTGRVDVYFGSLRHASATFTVTAAPDVAYPDFSDLSAWTLNGATSGIHGGGTVFYNGRHVLRLTDAFGQAGSAFLTNPIALAPGGSARSFSAAFEFQISDPQGMSDADGQGADGLALLIQGNGATALGVGGSGMGYQGVGNSLAIEIDTWDSGSVDGFNGNHVGVSLNGDLNSVARQAVATRLNNGAVWYAWVDYDATTQVLEVRVAPFETRPGSPLLSTSVDLAAVLGAADAWVGFTAGTGGAANDHDIRAFRLWLLP